MARPLLADPHFVKKASEGRAREINTCIGCNQACLDHIFDGKTASCLVNPLAAAETTLTLKPGRPIYIYTYIPTPKQLHPYQYQHL